MRFTKVFILLIINLLVSYRTTTAQASHSTVVLAAKKHRIGVDFGQANYINRDDLASPLLYKGRKKTIGLSYTYKGMKNWHWVQVNLMTGKLKTSSFRSSADHFYGHIQYGYARLLGPSGNMTFWLGGSWDNMISARNYSFLRSFSGRTTGIAVSNFNIVLLCDLLFQKKQSVVFSLSVPVLGYLLRNGYALVSRDITNRLTSLNSYHCVRFSSLYEHTLSASFKLRLTYWFLYHQYDHPRKTISVFHGLNGGIAFQF